MASFSIFSGVGGLSGKVDWSATAHSNGSKLNATLSITAQYGWYFVLNQGYSLKVKDSNGTVLKSLSGNTAGMNGTGTVTLLTISNLDIPYYGDKTVTIEANINLTNVYYESKGYYLSNYSKSLKQKKPWARWF